MILLLMLENVRKLGLFSSSLCGGQISKVSAKDSLHVTHKGEAENWDRRD